MKDERIEDNDARVEAAANEIEDILLESYERCGKYDSADIAWQLAKRYAAADAVRGSDAFDYHRVKEWALSSPRKPANLAFTASANRQVAYLIEDLDAVRPSASEDEVERVGKALAQCVADMYQQVVDITGNPPSWGVARPVFTRRDICEVLAKAALSTLLKARRG